MIKEIENTYKNKRVLLTGHTGFKGSWLNLWLKIMGAEVLGYSLEPNTHPSLHKVLSLNDSIIGNILDTQKLEKTFNDFQPEIVFHLAAQPLVRLSYAEPLLTYQTNVIGSLNVLEAARKCGATKAVVNITTDKCYENKEINYGYVESDPMGGYDMYSSSKGCVELMSESYRRSFLNEKNSFLLATARAGNVIGGGDWSQDRLIPDCIKAIENNKRIEIRNPMAIRPWQHVLDPLSGYLLLGKNLLEEGEKFAQGFNFGPSENNVVKVSKVAQKIVEYYGKGEVVVNKKDDLHEAELLMLNIDKAKKLMNWVPTYTADEAIKKTAEWYKNFYQNNEIKEFTILQIKEFEKDITWNKDSVIK